ncbi:ArnT family glycosyltransferase [Tundrisphaera sp. TA3]|uniref:ArnT family glycosyltransferase n=1 Tax=Tundrisphaera sp. TA3 TaxID=3435775 RepID=UPI003EBDE38B
MGTTGWRAAVARRADAIAAGLIVAGALALLVATLGDCGMAWDEGYVVERVDRLREWFARVAGDDSAAGRAWTPFLSWLEGRTAYLQKAGSTAGSPWSRESLRYYWQFSREEPNGHPPGYALLSLAGWIATHRFLPPLQAYRSGPSALFALTLGAVYLTMARLYGRAAAAMAALGLLSMPHVFGHAHLATTDTPTLCFWILGVMAFLGAVEAKSGDDGRSRGRAWTLAFGLAWGCAMATKFTGWFLPAPLIAWAIFYRDARAARVLAIGGAVAATVVYACNPTWWLEPVEGGRAFLRSNLTRRQLLPIPTLFFGRVYLFSLPWYNTLAWTAIGVPPATLALSLVGIGRVAVGRFRDRAGTLLLGCWAFFMVLRALPNAPGHDAERLFLPAFAFLACLSGIGVAAIGAGFGRHAGGRLARISGVLALSVALIGGSWSTWRYHPLQLSYYNALIGGLSGAARAGLEPTYYWDALTPDVRDWINAHTEPDRAVAFALPTVSFEYLHRWGLLRPSPLATPRTNPRWFVVMNRPGHLRYPAHTVGQYLLDHAKPAFVKTLDVAPDVPLIAIFSGVDALEADRIVTRLRSQQASPETPGR